MIAAIVIIAVVLVGLLLLIISTQRRLVVLDENMVRTSRLIYNNSVTKLNRDIRMFPVFLIAGILGFSQREYLEDYLSKVGMPNMK